MNFPIDQPLFQFFYWLINTPGVGSAIVGLIVGAAVASFAWTLRWIASAKNTAEEAHPFPPQH